MDNGNATVIPFPRSPGLAPAPRASAAPEAAAAAMTRLAAALAALDAALTRQQDAVVDWRRTLGMLGVGVGNLQQSLLAYHARLAELGARVDTLHASARRLERWADGVLKREATAATSRAEPND